MTNNREEQIYKAADKATYQTPPQYSELVHKSRKVMCAYEIGFIDGCVWADSHPHWISVEERLPEVGEKVIFYSPGIDDWLSGAFQQDGTWWNEEYGTHFYGVTHWMEIVPPRKEE